jgi:hypothetical protein
LVPSNAIHDEEIPVHKGTLLTRPLPRRARGRGTRHRGDPRDPRGSRRNRDHLGRAARPKRFSQLRGLVISDRADIHDFHLSGPGLDRVLTSVEFTGTKTFVLRLKGSYRFVCDPHFSIMHGRFVVA